jgi:hypothetical protein
METREGMLGQEGEGMRNTAGAGGGEVVFLLEMLLQNFNRGD